jgi:hypothetical protein
MEKVRILTDPDLPKGPSGISTGAVVTLVSTDGRTASGRRDAAPGSRQAPLPDAALREKFALCVAPFFDRAAAGAAFAEILGLAEASDVRAGLARILNRGSGR